MTTVTIDRRASLSQRERSDRRARPQRTHVIGQDLFRGVLVRERKRADRSNQPLVLALVGLNGGISGAPAQVWNRVIDALEAAKRETDVLGWFEQDGALGVILPEIPAAGGPFVAELEQRIRRELSRSLDADALGQLSVRLLVHPEPKGATDAVFDGVDPLIQQLKGDRSPVYTTLKRALDILGSAGLLALLAPVFLVLAALIKLTSKGPVFFRQTRVGERGKPFTMLKFRSMRVNASADIHQQYVTQFIKSGGQAANGGAAGVFKLTNDPRITPIGNFIRKTSLDELPQFWNVLCGSMSLVGPRPPLQYEVEQYKPWHCRRVLEAKPGITGLWQVEGRSRTTFDEMVRLDLRYARSCSIWTDVKILLATPAAVIAGKGAC
ncbi:MAG TPA: sugar transferase [Vicinamibacterales bacterium]|jgi:lipopolysaccharide/colanic/teichoic acid biosynthesis glycosyltransferase|nr:sugar transferase [Vicinamibacterales bacterium]